MYYMLQQKNNLRQIIAGRPLKFLTKMQNLTAQCFNLNSSSSVY